MVENLPSGLTGICTSRSVTADLATIPSIKRSGRARCSARLVRIDVNVPTSDTRGYTIPSDNPFAGSDSLERSTRSGRSVCATRGSSVSTIPRSAALVR